LSVVFSLDGAEALPDAEIAVLAAHSSPS